MVAYYSLEIMPTKRNMCEDNYSMEDSTFLVPVDMDREEVGHLFENYNLNSAYQN